MFFQVPLYEKCVLTFDLRQGPVDSDDVSHLFDCLLAEFGQTVSSLIVFLVDQHIDRAVFGQQADGLTVGGTFLATTTVI